MIGYKTKSDVALLTAVELKEWLDRREPITILDVREDDERAYCALPLPPTARDLHIPMHDVSERLEEVRASVGSDPLVVYCHHGVRSMSVATWLSHQGLGNVHNLTGGIDAWSKGLDPSVPRY
jgi:rhodanese-related sulfurtransferase